jgi:concentrative nucleoside transporter, CNT family
MGSNLIGLVGIAVLLGIAYALSTDRKAINFRIVGAAFALQVFIAVMVLYTDGGSVVLASLANGVNAVIGYSREGINMIFGSLASQELLQLPEDVQTYKSDGRWLGQGEGEYVVVFAVHVLPVIIFFSALMSVMYHLRIMQWVVKIFGTALHKIIGTGPIESMNAAANVFVGQTEAPLVVRPYLRGLTEPQFYAVMVSGVASVAGTVLVAYSSFGAKMEFLLAASFMAAPGGLLMAKMLMPDDPIDKTGQDSNFKIEKSDHENVFLAAAMGASDGLKLAVNIGAMLIAFVALIALLNGIIGGIASWFDVELTLQMILGWIFAPLMYLLSIPWAEAQQAGALFGEKLILNEFVAFIHLNDYMDLVNGSERTRAIVTFTLCGFANLSSIAILLGGLGVLVPEKRALIARFGLRAVAAGSLSNLMSAALAGLLLTF